MASQATKWVIGCGVAGCGFVVLIGLLLIGGSAWFIRDTVAPFEDAVKAREQLDERFGAVESYTPPADGTIPNERMEAFLTVREASQPARTALAELFGSLPISEQAARELESQPTLDKIKSVFRITSSAFGLGVKLGELFAERNRALLDVGMGMGEYTYLYEVSYWAWLEHDPREGPEEQSDSATDDRTRIRVGDATSDDSLRRVRRNLREMLRSQLGAASDLPGIDDWKRALEAEVAALEADRSRFPWQEGVPEPLASSLEPFRARLEATYSPLTNAFELSRNRRRGSVSFTTE